MYTCYEDNSFALDVNVPFYLKKNVLHTSCNNVFVEDK
jgi:hypothetical protein